MDIDARAFGQLEGQVQALANALEQQSRTQEAQIATLTKTLEAQNVTLANLTSELSAIKTTLSEARGGWKTLLAIGGASATASGLLAWAAQALHLRIGQ